MIISMPRSTNVNTNPYLFLCYLLALSTKNKIKSQIHITISLHLVQGVLKQNQTVSLI